ncbi:hypothetical protein EKO27_g6669 [Xylaria grammica]|uniref:Uncharacterized protein n=1 Tax=Xylaria grammica TaxID=363999 RepID=A0A439D1V8_9PEZI|nr:hypothetical protein EKO27_g6669 [Xylaria grammica]
MGPLDITSIDGMPSASGWRTEPESRYGNFNSPMIPEGRLPWEPLPHQPTDRSEEIWQNRSPSASELELAFDESSECSESSQSEDDYDYDYMSGDTHESDEDELDESSTYEFDSESYYSGSSSGCSDDTAVGTETVEAENTSLHRNGPLRGPVDGVTCDSTAQGSFSHLNTISPWFPSQLYSPNFHWSYPHTMYGIPVCRRFLPCVPPPIGYVSTNPNLYLPPPPAYARTNPDGPFFLGPVTGVPGSTGERPT